MGSLRKIEGIKASGKLFLTKQWSLMLRREKLSKDRAGVVRTALSHIPLTCSPPRSETVSITGILS